MRIAIFIKSTTFHKGFGGLETQNKVLCEGFTNKGHTVYVFSPQKELTIENAVENNVSYVFISSSYRALFSGMNKNSWVNKSVQAFKKIHKENRFDIVLSQSSAGVGIIQKKNELGVKVISISHGTALGELTTFLKTITSLKEALFALRNIQYFLRQYFGRQREFILHSNKVIAVSNYVKQHLIEETFIPEDRVVVINNGIDISPFNALQSPVDSSIFKLLYLGQVTKEKGADLLPEIAKQLKDVTIEVIGDGAYLNTLKELISAEKISNIVLRGKSSHEEVIQLLCSGTYSAFIFPTKRAEGFPMVLPEAMLAKLPIVAFNCGGVSDAIQNNITGFLIEPGNIKEFINKIIWLRDNTNGRLKMGDDAKIEASEKFSLSTMLTKYEKVISEILK